MAQGTRSRRPPAAYEISGGDRVIADTFWSSYPAVELQYKTLTIWWSRIYIVAGPLEQIMRPCKWEPPPTWSEAPEEERAEGGSEGAAEGAQGAEHPHHCPLGQGNGGGNQGKVNTNLFQNAKILEIK